MVRLLMDKDVIDVMSTLIAKMEAMAYDEGRTGVFRTAGGRALFGECVRRMAAGSGLPPREPPFDIDAWYRATVAGGPRRPAGGGGGRPPKVRRDIDPSMYRQPMETDWLTALMALELELGGASAGARPRRGSALRILHNILELEDQSMEKLARHCKAERQYRFDGVAAAQPAASAAVATRLLMPAPAEAPRHGSVEDMLRRK